MVWEEARKERWEEGILLRTEVNEGAKAELSEEGEVLLGGETAAVEAVAHLGEVVGRDEQLIGVVVCRRGQSAKAGERRPAWEGW